MSAPFGGTDGAVLRPRRWITPADVRSEIEAEARRRDIQAAADLNELAEHIERLARDAATLAALSDGPCTRKAKARVVAMVTSWGLELGR